MPSFVEIGQQVPEKKNFEGFVYGNGGHLCHVFRIIYVYILIPLHINTSNIKFGFDWPSCFREEEYYGYIHVFCPGVGSDVSLVSISFLESLIFRFSLTDHFLQDFPFE